MTAAAAVHQTRGFVRRTSLEANEYHRNFRKIDCETIAKLTSFEASRACSQITKVYLSLLNAPAGCWEREGVLRFSGEEGESGWVTAWGQLVSLVGVASATARKALLWMHGQGVIGYFAGKNGVGIRIFLNRASSSIGRKPAGGQKNLSLVRASNVEPRASANDKPFKDSFADLEVLEKDLNPRAPKNGAEPESVAKASAEQPRAHAPVVCAGNGLEGGEAAPAVSSNGTASVEKIVRRLKTELEPFVRNAAAQAAAQSAAQEVERTRRWFEAKALPKAVRVAQRETYELLRKQGAGNVPRGQARAGLEVGRAHAEPSAPSARTLTPAEILETAETCVALLETQGKPVEVTLAGMSVEAGGWLLPEDAARVREEARGLALSWGR